MIKNININKEYVYLISDIHSNIKLFKEIIDDINLKEDDYLFILGDVIEKDDYNIENLDYLMHLKKKCHLYILLGNCDNVINEFKRGADLNKLYKYSHILKKTILNEFYLGVGIDYNKDFDVYEALDIINIKYKKYFDFINSFDKALYLNDKVLLMHADKEESIKKKLFTKEEIDNIKFKELNICGHLPIPLLYDKKHFISVSPTKYNEFLYIDGGNNVVPFGGLNLIKLNLNDLKYTSKFYSNFSSFIVLEDTIEINGSYNALKEEYGSYNIIDDITIYKRNDIAFYGATTHLVLDSGKIYGYDTLNMFGSFKKGEVIKVAVYSTLVSIVLKNDNIYLINSNKIKKL